VTVPAVAARGRRDARPSGALRVSGDWSWLETLPGAADSPACLDERAAWLPAPVPGTVADAMRVSGRWRDTAPVAVHRHDYWYRLRFAATGRRLLRLRGLAGAAQAWVNGRPIGAPQALCDACDAEVDLAGINTLHLCFRASVPRLHAARGTLCWRVASAFQTSGVIGHAAAQSTPLHAVGLLQPVEMLELGRGDVLAEAAVDLSAGLEDGAGRVAMRLHLHGEAPAQARLRLGDANGFVHAPLVREGAFTLAAEVRLDHPRLWWPHTHGQPARYRVLAESGGHVLDCGRVGLRSVRGDWHGRDPLPRINDVPVFCRGARLEAGELAALASSPLAARHWLRLARGAGMNVLYLDRDCAPAADLRSACDAVGMLLWHEGMNLPDAAWLPEIAGVPCARTLDALGLSQAVGDPRWKAGVLHRSGTLWDAEDVRDRYLRSLYGVDPPRLRRSDPQRYLRLSRALAAELASGFISGCRREGGRSGLALVPALRDVALANGTGVVDVQGRPKSAWHAMRAACRPLQVLLGTDAAGRIRVDLLNETATARDVRIRVCWIGSGVQAHAEAGQELQLGAHQSLMLRPPPQHGGSAEAGDVVLATLSDARSGEPLSQAAHLPDRRADGLPQAGLHVEVLQDAGQWWLEISATRFARWVHIEDHVLQPAQDWFHLAPGGRTRIRLLHEGGCMSQPRAVPAGRVWALNQDDPVHYGG
jgi:beta-mannosidase